MATQDSNYQDATVAKKVKAPAWWKEFALTATTGEGAPTSFLRLTNALIPFLGSQEQLAARTFLGTDKSPLFRSYAKYTPDNETLLQRAREGAPRAPRPMSEARGEFLSADRAKAAIARLEALRGEAKLTEEQLGPGYSFLKQTIDLLRQYGIRPEKGEKGMTRKEFETLQAQLSAMVEQAKSNQTIAPYAQLAQQFINPVLQEGQMMPTQQVGGNTVYGLPSKRLFG